MKKSFLDGSCPLKIERKQLLCQIETELSAGLEDNSCSRTGFLPFALIRATYSSKSKRHAQWTSKDVSLRPQVTEV